MKNCYYDDGDDACIRAHMMAMLHDDIAVVGAFRDEISDYYHIRDILSFQLLMHLLTSFSADVPSLRFIIILLLYLSCD